MAGELYQVRIPPWAQVHFGAARLTRRFTTKAVGLAWQRDIQARIARLKAGAEAESIGIRSPLEITLERAAEGWLASLTIRPRSILSYRWALHHPYALAGSTPLSRFDGRAWDDYVSLRRADGATNDALHRERQAIQALAKWALSRGYHVNPLILVIPKVKVVPKVKRGFNPHEMRSAIDRLTGRDRVIAELAVGTGLRPGEVRACRVEWLRLDAAVINVPHCVEFSPKGGRPRTIPLPKRLVGVLTPWVASLASGGQGLLFPPESHQHKGTGIALWRVVRRLKAAGVPIKSMHCFRHHYLSYLASKGVPLQRRMEVAGHAHSKTADIYSHTDPGYLDDVRAAMDSDEVASEVASGGRRVKSRRAA